MYHKAFCLSVFTVLACLLVGSRAQPILSGYAQAIDFAAHLETSVAAPFPYYFTVYFTVNDTTLYGAAVTNHTGWVAWGISATGKMVVSSSNPSDAIASYYDASSQTMFIKDLSLSAKSASNAVDCATFSGVCADENVNGCTNNVQLGTHYVNGTYKVWTFTRPTAATDSCDRAVITAPTTTLLIAAAGNMNGGTTLPYSMQQHTWRTTTAIQSAFSTGPIPGSMTSTTSTSSTASTATTSTSSSSTGTVSTSGSTSGTTGTTGTSTTGGGTNGPVQCSKDISQQCLDTCAPRYVDYCRCNITSNTLVYICKDTFVINSAGSVAPTLLALILGFLALFQ
uniref:Predicted protein n=1 Tax=Hordeum vulgare subsp. vulgare TaxID=112509 RepID=F2DZX8_HORVV|nr:predicted protein [Hordeum vulgare subsp. vulgare]